MAEGKVNRSKARSSATECLERHKVVRPPTPLESIVQAEGLTVVKLPWGPQHSINSLLFHQKRLIALNSDKPLRRQRFSLAHELGHYVLNHHYLREEEGAHIDIDHPREHVHPVDGSVFEVEANVFAGELLVPRSALIPLRPKKPAPSDGGEEDVAFHRPFATALDKLRPKPSRELSLKELADLFDVSEQVITIALMDNGLL